MTEIEKYSPDQARDKYGRWTAGAGGAKFAAVRSRITSGTMVEEASPTGSRRTFKRSGTYRTEDGEEFALKFYERHHSIRGDGEDWRPDIIEVSATGEDFPAGGDATLTGVWHLESQNRDYTINAVWTNPAHQRKGLATAMLAFARDNTHGGARVDHSLIVTEDGMAWSEMQKVDHEYRTGGFEIAKYSASQPRDDHGRWTDGAISWGPSEATGSKYLPTTTRKGTTTITTKSGEKLTATVTHSKQDDIGYGPGDEHWEVTIGEPAEAPGGLLLIAAEGYAGGYSIGYMDATWRGGWTGQPAEIGTMGVAEERRREGIASGMLEALRGAAADSGHEVIHSTSLTAAGKAFSEVVKYAPGQPRDERGRFAANGLTMTASMQFGATSVDFQRKRVTEAVARAGAAIEATHGGLDYTKVAIKTFEKANVGALGVQNNTVGVYFPGEKSAVYVRHDVNSESMVAGAFVHEFGHMLDFESVGYAENMQGMGPAMSLRLKMESTDAYFEVRDRPEMQEWMKYAKHPREVFARGYAQWVASRSGDPELLTAIETQIGHGQWRHEEFEPIAERFDKFFAGQGMAPTGGVIVKYAPGQARDDHGRFTGRSGRSYGLTVTQESRTRTAIHAQHGDQRVATMYYTREGERAVVNLVTVKPDFRRDGVATAMLEMARSSSPVPVVHDSPNSQTDAGKAWAAVAKYSPDQPRDDQGQWTSGGFIGATDSGVELLEVLAEEGTLAAIEKVHRMPEQVPVVVTLGSGQTPKGAAASYNAKNHTIDVTRAGLMTPNHTFVHEYGHSLDMRAFGKGKSATVMRSTPAFADLRAAMEASPEHAAWKAHENGVYLTEPREMFARGYAQWVTLRSGHGPLVTEQGRRKDGWSEESFEKLAPLYDRVFRDAGLLN